MKLKKIKCIYLRTNLVNGKQYVGQTIDFERSASNGHLNKEGNHTYKGYEWYQNPI